MLYLSKLNLAAFIEFCKMEKTRGGGKGVKRKEKEESVCVFLCVYLGVVVGVVGGFT